MIFGCFNLEIKGFRKKDDFKIKRHRELCRMRIVMNACRGVGGVLSN